MKNIFKLFAGSVVIIAALAACGKKGGGGSASANGVAYGGGCVTDASGVCVGGYNSGYAYVGTGTWRGSLTITNQQLLQQLYSESGRCRRGYSPYPTIQQPGFAFQCVQASFLRVSVMVQNGQVPGRGYFSIVPTLNGGQSGMALAKYADAYLNGGSNGFLLAYTPPQGFNVGVPYQFPGQPAIQQPGTLQIVSNWTDASHTLLNVNVVYKNGVIASGQLFNPNAQQQMGIGTGVGGVYW